jgi:hypothetical protein
MVEVGNAIASQDRIERVRDPHEIVSWVKKIGRLEGAM